MSQKNQNKKNVPKKGYKKPNNKGKPKVTQYRIRSPRVEQIAEDTLRHNALEPAVQATDGMVLQAIIQDTAVQQLFLATSSYLFAFGGITNWALAAGQPPALAFSAIAYLIEGIVKYASGTIEVDRMPKIHAIYAAMLRQRTCRFRYGNVVYTPTIQSQSYNTSMTLENGDMFFNIPPDTGGALTITSSSSSILPDRDAYTQVLSCFTREACPLSTVVNMEALPNVYKKDPSAFSRTYAYIGANGVTGGGLINDAELEVNFKMPSFSKFVIYDPADTQIARVLKLQSGPPCLNLAFALTDKQFKETHLRNPIPVIYKFLDLNEIYLYVASWLATAFSSQTIVPNNGFPPGTLSMSKNDFLVLLRQAIMLEFVSSQLQGQFVQPLSQATGMPSMFRPLVLDPATIPCSAYAGFALPAALRENLSMLKPASYVPPQRGQQQKPSSLRVTYVPVWGWYNDDEVADILVPTGGEGENYPLFQKEDVLPTYASITDLRVSGANVKLNPNSQQAIALLQLWNKYVETQNGLTQVGVISSDSKIQGNLLMYSRVQEPVQRQLILQNLKVQDPCTRYVRETITIQGVGKEKAKVKVIAPATLFTTTILSIKPIPSELNNNLFALIIPTVRLDVDSAQDKLSQVAWQTYTGECASQPYDFTNAGGISMVSRAVNTAGRLVNAQFSPTTGQDSLAQALQELGKHSWGSDLLGQILSGLVGLIPVVGPAASALVSNIF